MKGANRMAVRATFQVDQMDAMLREVLGKTELHLLCRMITDLIDADGAVERGEDPDIGQHLWSVMLSAAVVALGNEITRRAIDAKS